MAKSKLESWRERMHELNEERSLLVYRLMDEAGHDPTDWGAIAQVQASDHPELVDVNNKIADHIADHPGEEE